MKSLRQIQWMVVTEGRLFVQFPKLAVAAFLVMLLPALYVLIYLSSVWDPVSHTDALPVALVNLDRDVQYRDQVFNVGRELSAKLQARKPFGFVEFASENEARQQVRDGRMAFALIFPPDFSSNALPGQDAGAGKLVVFTSEGNNYQSASIARNFASELGHEVNESLNARRWQLVLNQAAGSQRSVEQLHKSIAQLRAGAREVSLGSSQLHAGARESAAGAAKLTESAVQLSDGMRQVGNGLRTMDAKRARNSELRRLKSGTQALADGHRDLGKGLAELRAGHLLLVQGATDFRDDARASLLVPSRVGDGLEQLLGGLNQFDGGLQTAMGAQQQLGEGADKLNATIETLNAGIIAMNTGVRTMVNKLPEDRQLDEFNSGALALASATSHIAEGTRKVKLGGERLEGGLDLLASSLPANVDQPGGSAQGLAHSVVPRIEIAAPVPNSGNAFGPNVVAAALWLGAGIAAFLFNVRSVPVQAQNFAPPIQLAGKLLLPLGIVWSQGLMVLALIHYGLHVHILEPAIFCAILLLSASTFLLIVFALTRAFGDAGKAMAMLFLALQLTSSGGVMPVELSGGLFAQISPWLPLTWVVQAMKASMFGAYDSGWQEPLMNLGLCCAVALGLAAWVGRWRYAEADQMRPSVDL